MIVLWLTLVARSYVNPFLYRIVDERTIVLQTSEGPFTWTPVTRVTETSFRVRITVESFEWFGLPGTAAAKLVELTVRLQEPLGSREVTDGRASGCR